jgi:hypothetical protein
MGGLKPMIAAAHAPERLVGAVLNDVGPELDPAGFARIRGYAGAAKTVDLGGGGPHARGARRNQRCAHDFDREGDAPPQTRA